MIELKTRKVASLMAAAVAAATLTVGVPTTASAADCTVTYNAEGFPRWSGCSTTIAPGKFGPIRMGKTSVASAKARNYLAYNRLCERWDGVAAFSDWKSKKGKIVWWRGGDRTSKGLLPSDSLERAKQLYPKLTPTRFIANDYIAGEGWQVYSTKTKRGWLDLYRYNTGNTRNNFFAVRALSLKKPQGFALDGC
jgi:hypothetical protein